MKKRLNILFILLLCGLPVFSQKSIPVIRAHSTKADIKDGREFKKGYWNIVPEAKPDIYATSGKKVTFYTDLDSISFKLKPGSVYNFIILLNDRDSAYTQVKYEREKHVPTYLEVLKKGSKYDYEDKRHITKFTYTPETDSDLVVIRNEFKLDSVAGTGNEVSKILNLLHWVHNSIHHNGSLDDPGFTTISNLMNICINEKKTLNCGSLATVLENTYLAIGIKARRVVCLPKDSTDFDCHSIVIAYSNTLNKWLWVDPTNDAYVMNEKGELLSISEVRERLVKNKPLILNPDANWNHINSISKEYYLYNYMAKNLYAFECFVSEGGSSRGNLLLPAEYKGIIPRTKWSNPLSTNNPDLFWVKPDL